jgi:(R,R)-butanediol dehydrogenase/meso-butanediol dehydrogenase/diacetyl reductase
MNAAVYRGKESLEYQQVPVPVSEDGWATIEVDYCGICGTDLNIFGGGHPRAKGPLIMGHEFSGRVVDHPTMKEGTRVTVRPILSCGACDACHSGYSHACENLRLIGIDRNGAMAQFVTAPIDEIIPLPENISTKLGSLVEPFAVGVHSIRESDFKPGDNAIVFGAGPIGLSTAISLKLLGAKHVVIVEVHPYRKKLAKELGFTIIDPKGGNVKAEIKNHFNGTLADVIFDCAAHPSVAELLVDISKVKGQIVLVGTYKNPTPLDLQNITFKELSIKGTRVYTKKDYDIALDLLTKDYDFEKIITHEINVSKVEEGFKALLDGNAIKVVVAF